MCELDNSRIGQSGRPLGFLRYRNRRLERFHRHRTVQHRLSRCNSRAQHATQTILPVALLNRLAPQVQGNRVAQEGRAVQEDRLRLSPLEDPEVQARPSDQAALGRKRPIQPLRRWPPLSEKAAWLLLSGSLKLILSSEFYNDSSVNGGEAKAD